MSIQARKQLQFKAVKAAGDGTPTDEELSLINSYALRELGADEVYVRRMYLAHNAIDRDDEVFSAGLLDDFARTLPGKGVFVKHPSGWDGDSGPGEGVFIAAEILKMSSADAMELLGPLEFLPGTEQARVLKATYFIPRIEGDTENKRLIAKIDAGVVRFVSIGFAADHRSPFEGAGGKLLASVLHGPGEALEGSFVWLGAQPGARNAKALNKGNSDVDELERLKQQNKTLEADKRAAEELADENAAKAKSFDAAKGAVGDLMDDPLTLKARLEEATAYRKSLVDEAVKHRRLLGMTGDDAAALEQAEKFYGGMPIDMLKREVEALAAKSPAGKGSQFEGSDPNATGADKGAGEQGEGVRGDLLEV